MLVNAHAVLDTPESHGNLTCSNPEADENAFSVYKREKQSGGEHCKARASKYSCYSNQHLKYVMIDDRHLNKIMWLKALAHHSRNCKKCSFLPYTLELLSQLQQFFQHFHIWATILTTIFKEKPLHCVVGLQSQIITHKILQLWSLWSWVQLGQKIVWSDFEVHYTNLLPGRLKILWLVSSMFWFIQHTPYRNKMSTIVCFKFLFTTKVLSALCVGGDSSLA